MRLLTFTDATHNNAEYTVQLTAKQPSCPLLSLGFIEQGIGHNSTMDWHKEVIPKKKKKKHQRMLMAVEHMAHNNMSVNHITIKCKKAHR